MGTNVEVAPPPQPQVPVQYMQQQFPQHNQQQHQQHILKQQQQQQFGSPAQPLSSLPPSPPSNPPSQPSSLVGTSSLTQPLMPKASSSSKQEQQASEDEGLKANTRMNMRRQKDIAAMAGIKCSQF